MTASDVSLIDSFVRSREQCCQLNLNAKPIGFISVSLTSKRLCFE